MCTLSVIVANDRKVSWTCHEHAGAWSRSGSLSASGESAAVGPPGLPSSAASSTTNSGAGPATGAFGVGDQCINPGNMLGSRKDPKEHDAESSITVQLEGGDSHQACGVEPAAAADLSDSKTSVGSVGKQGKGLGVFAKIKGRFGRHAG